MTTTPPGDRPARRWRLSWDRLVAVGGLLGIVNEAACRTCEVRPYLLATFIVMLGLPIPAGLDRWLRTRNGNGNGNGKGKQ